LLHACCEDDKVKPFSHLLEEEVNMGPLDHIERAGHSINEDIHCDMVVSDGFDGGVDEGLVEVKDECLSFEVGWW